MPVLYPDATSYVNIRLSIRDYLNEPVAVFWSDDELDRYIQMACMEISRNSLCVERRDTLNLTGAQEYLLGTNQFLRIYTATYSASGVFGAPDNEALIRIHPRMIRHTNLDGIPKQYYLFRNQVGIYPDNGVGQVFVYASVAVDEPLAIPEILQPLIIQHVMAQCRMKERKNQEAAMYYSFYINALRQYRADIYERVPDSKDKFQIPDRTVYAPQ